MNKEDNIIEKKLDAFREEYKEAYKNIFAPEVLEGGNKWFEDFLRQALTEVQEETRREDIEIIDGHFEVYKDGENRGKVKHHEDSCCNEVLDEVRWVLSSKTKDNEV